MTQLSIRPLGYVSLAQPRVGRWAPDFMWRVPLVMNAGRGYGAYAWNCGSSPKGGWRAAKGCFVTCILGRVLL
jgi:hypothetical protein